MKLSPHFTLEELTLSQTATRMGIDNIPDDEQLANLRQLAQLLEQVRSAIGTPIYISSGFRCRVLNSMVRGSSTSAHMDGRAADITAPGFGTPHNLAERIAITELPFDQVILEFDKWVHISISDNPRQMVLTATRSDTGKTHYRTGLA